MPNFACRKNNIHDLFYSKKQKLSVQQNFQRVLAEEAAAAANENRVKNKFPPNEPMVKRHAADEHMSERDNHNDGRGTADDPFSDSDASFVLARDDSMSSEDDDDQNDFILMTCLDWKQRMMGQLTMDNHSRLLPLLARAPMSMATHM
jgi:hypothetical protein